MKDWHRSDIFAALVELGWTVPVPIQIPPEQYHVGEAYQLSRGSDAIELYFVADIGTGFHGLRSIEAVVAEPSGEELWLHRTRDSKWQMQLTFWANRLAGLPFPETREPNLPFGSN